MRAIVLGISVAADGFSAWELRAEITARMWYARVETHEGVRWVDKPIAIAEPANCSTK
jgi:hypothetical protein